MPAAATAIRYADIFADLPRRYAISSVDTLIGLLRVAAAAA